MRLNAENATCRRRHTIPGYALVHVWIASIYCWYHNFVPYDAQFLFLGGQVFVSFPSVPLKLRVWFGVRVASQCQARALFESDCARRTRVYVVDCRRH